MIELHVCWWRCSKRRENFFETRQKCCVLVGKSEANFDWQKVLCNLQHNKAARFPMWENLRVPASPCSPRFASEAALQLLNLARASIPRQRVLLTHRCVACKFLFPFKALAMLWSLHLLDLTIPSRSLVDTLRAFGRIPGLMHQTGLCS